MKSYKAVIFDLDGTLLNTLDDLHDAVNHTMEYFGYPKRTVEEVRSFVGNGVDRLIDLSLPGGSKDINRDAAIREYRSYYSTHAEIKTKPYDGIAELIDRLISDGISVAVASNKPHKATTELCAKIFPNIKTVCGEGEADGIRRKPHPDMVNYAVKELGIMPSECVYVGDSEVDVETAKNAQIDVIAVLWGFRSRNELKEAGAKKFAENTDELYNLIIKL